MHASATGKAVEAGIVLHRDALNWETLRSLIFHSGLPRLVLGRPDFRSRFQCRVWSPQLGVDCFSVYGVQT